MPPIDPATAGTAKHHSLQTNAAPAGCCAACPSHAAGNSKRAALKVLAGAVLAAGAGVRAAQAADDHPRAGDWLVGVDDDDLKPVAAADLKTNEKQLLVFPFDPVAKRARSDSRLNRILLIKLDPASLNAETMPRAAEGVLAYSAICTHQGCDVNSWRPKEKTLLCFCHFSQFQPAEGCSVVAGPAPRPLPSLPLTVEGGRLVVAGSFSEAPGGGR